MTQELGSPFMINVPVQILLAHWDDLLNVNVICLAVELVEEIK